MSNISSWSTSAAANNAASPDGFPEGMAPSGVNDSAREVMGAVKRWYVDAQWRIFDNTAVRQSNNSFLVSVTATDVFTAGRRLLMIDGGVTIAGDIIASSMSGANTLVTVSSSALSASLSQVSVGIIDPLRRADPDIGERTTTGSVTASDYVEVWQSGTGLRRRALITNAVRGSTLSLQSEVNLSAAATSYTLASSVPAWVKRITISLVGFSTNGTSVPIIQIGDSGGVETTGYSGAASNIGSSVGTANNSSGFLLQQTHAASNVLHGTIILSLEDSSDNTWAEFGLVASSDSAATYPSAGSKALSAVLDRVILTMVNGTDTGDAGTASVLLEG